MPTPGNPNPTPNPEIANIGKATQFGQPKGADPVQAAKSKEKAAAWSIRAELKHIAAQDIDMTDIDNELKRLMSHNKGKASFARIMAVRMMEKAIKKMEAPMANAVIENIEGKLSQEIVIPNNKPAPTNNQTIEEASNVYKEFMGS